MQRFVQRAKGNSTWPALSGRTLCGGQIVRCTKGAIYDVVVDLRQTRRPSKTGSRWFSAQTANMVYVPEGCGHGFLTLEDETEVFYQMSEFYSAESARGVRWDDPAFQHCLARESRSNFRTRPDLSEFRRSAVHLLKEFDRKDNGNRPELHDFAADLYPICRSITGDGIRQTLRLDQESNSPANL